MFKFNNNLGCIAEIIMWYKLMMMVIYINVYV